MRNAEGDLPEQIAVYRSGLTADEGEDIERKLRSGAKKLVFSTSALELGIDIGGIDSDMHWTFEFNDELVATRRSCSEGWSRGSIVLVPGESPMGTYYAQRPEELFSRQHETLALNLSNELVSCQHYTCAVHETCKGEAGHQLDILGEQITQIQSLRDEGKLRRAEFYCEDPHIDVKRADTQFAVERDGKKFGTLEISNGSLIWFPPYTNYGYKVTWQKFHEIMEQNVTRIEKR